MTAKQIIEKAKAEIGVHEAPPNSNNVKYNTWYYGREVYDGDISPKATYPWCAVFISWLFKAEQGLCKKTALCVDMLSWFEARNQIVKDPQAGDIVFFKYKTNNRRTNHVGLVVSVSPDGRTINTIEGNTSITSQDNGGKVMQRNRYSNIVAYARPKYAAGSVAPSGRKSNEEIAKEVKAGLWGVQPEREKRLTEAGYDYQEIRRLVNQLYKR